jgi:predicted transposase YbfD/YdcC
MPTFRASNLRPFVNLIGQMPPDPELAPFLAIFSSLEDPRRDHLKQHPLPDVLVLVVMGMLAECENWVEIQDFGLHRQEWFQSRGLFPCGMPSHDTLGRIFRALDSAVFASLFASWVATVVEQVPGVVAIDGKTSRASGDGKQAKPIHTVSAWSSETGLTLAHVPVQEKSNEITAIPEILDVLALKGCTVTIDAMGCQKNIAEHIRRRGGDYLLQVKANQSGTLDDIASFFDDADQRAWNGVEHTHCTAANEGHGRREVRHAWACPIKGQWMDSHGWKDLRQIIRIRRERTLAGEASVENSYYISSDSRDAYHQLTCARQHWGIENRVHWVLDIAFNEDRSRVRKDHAGHNLITIRRFVLNLLRLEPSKKGIRRRRKMAGWDLDYLVRLLALAAKPVSLGG